MSIVISDWNSHTSHHFFVAVVLCACSLKWQCHSDRKSLSLAALRVILTTFSAVSDEKLHQNDDISVSMLLHCWLPTLTDTKMLSFWRNFRHWLYWKLSFRQFPVQPLMKISSKWRHFYFSAIVQWFSERNCCIRVLYQYRFWLLSLWQRSQLKIIWNY